MTTAERKKLYSVMVAASRSLLVWHGWYNSALYLDIFTSDITHTSPICKRLSSYWFYIDISSCYYWEIVYMNILHWYGIFFQLDARLFVKCRYRYLVISQFTFHSRFVTGEDELKDQMALQNFYAGFFLGTFLAFWLPTFKSYAAHFTWCLKNPELRLLSMHASVVILLSNLYFAGLLHKPI